MMSNIRGIVKYVHKRAKHRTNLQVVQYFNNFLKTKLRAKLPKSTQIV